ncbi:hypothetical protein TNCV_2273241 [Trichonephila clavipes]|nr:hypothetical protein TNCV_2273241 [Trichonephila clavipes]
MSLLGMNKIRKTPDGLDCSTGSSEEFVAVDDDNVCTAQLWQRKKFCSFFKAKKNTIDTDSDDENEMNNAASIPTSSAMRNILKIPFKNCGGGDRWYHHLPSSGISPNGEIPEVVWCSRPRQGKRQAYFQPLAR